MAYTMVHVLIAEEVQRRFERKVDYATYILGAIAPDAVHSIPNFVVEFKERSHLFAEGLKWGQVGSESEVKPWLDNIQKYYLKNRNKYNVDFLLGYIVHLLADVYCSVHFYGPFMNSISGNLEAQKMQYKKENYNVNYYLFTLFSKREDLLKVFQRGEAITLEGIIEKEAIEQRIRQLFEFEFMAENWDISHIEDQKICSIGDMEKLIQEASKFIEKIFIDNYYLHDE